MSGMRRRTVVTLLGGTAAWPCRLMAQPATRVYRIGVLVPFPAGVLASFFDALRQFGFVEGQNLTIDSRGFAANYEKFSTIAAELVETKVDAILCAGDVAIRAAQAATTTIPILAGTDDMVGAGLVRSLARPGGNTTGVSILAADLDGKRQEVLFDFFPAERRMAVLADMQTTRPDRLRALRDAAHLRGVALSMHPVERIDDISSAIEAAKVTGAAALNVLASPMLHGNRYSIIVRTAALRFPAIYQWPETAREGGLLAYGPRFSEIFGLWARQVAKVLRGANPTDLPVEQPTKFELVINLKTAKALGLAIAPTLLARADEVIE